MEKVSENLKKSSMKSKTGSHHSQLETDSFQSVSQFTIFKAALALTFFAEWGDRSQITTIALSAANNAYVVFFGSIIGHAICSGMGVLGGKIIAAHISEKFVNLVGGLLFIVFGFVTALQLYADVNA